MKKILVFLLASSIVTLLSAQNVSIDEEPAISRMMDRMVQINKNTVGIEGWRIQILATTDRLKMEKAKEEFLAKYPRIPVDWTHSKPYYKLRAGAFATKLEAQRLLYRLKSDYPSAYPAKDSSINPRELIGS
ncbi:MAG: SPOR domain-containing protein [Bacteroidota bacterium]